MREGPCPELLGADQGGGAGDVSGDTGSRCCQGPCAARAWVGEILTTTCQPARATQTRRKALAALHKSPEWKALRKAFLDEHGWYCDWCGTTKYLSVHHPFRSSYSSLDVYKDFHKSQCVVLCRKCHTAVENNLVLCTYRDGELHDDGENHYRYHDAPYCSYCRYKLFPEEKELREIERNRIKKAKKQYEKKQKEKYKNKRIIKKPDKFINGGTN
jgi:aerobic-type carbon monoxide dehydrogenase small subunit (CoxS/CutS family)